MYHSRNYWRYWAYVHNGGVILNQEITDNTVVFKLRNIGLLSYPIGSIYQSTNSTNPSNIFGGTWSQIKDRFLLACGDTYSNGSTGGEAVHTLTISETPAHTHTRGTMNITGGGLWNDGSTYKDFGTRLTGAFYATGTNKWGNGSTVDQDNSTVEFDASRNWTGETSSVGGSSAHNNMPPYFAIYTWYRTA